MLDNLDLLLINGYLIDGTGREPIENSGVGIKDGKIVLILEEEKAQIIDFRGTIVDLQGAAILPGIINTHVHINFSDVDYSKKWLSSGVTTIRDMGICDASDLKDALGKRKLMNDSHEFPRIVMPGKFLTAAGGYGGLNPIAITSKDDAAEKVDELLDMGCDFIKTVLEDGFDESTFGLPKLNPELLRHICDEAHKKGAKVSAHLSQAKNLEILVNAGIDEAAHIVYDELSDELIEKMVNKKIWMVPTMNLYKFFSDMGAPFYKTCLSNLQKFVNAGGKIAIGTDFIEENLPWFELGMPLYEFQMLEAAGLSKMDIIIAATKNASEVIGLSETIGTIEQGKIADIIAVKGNPLGDLNNLRVVDLVIKNGKIIKNNF